MPHEGKVKFGGNLVKGDEHEDYGVNELADHGGSVVPQPEESALGFFLPEMEAPDVVDLGEDEGNDRSDDESQGSLENGDIAVVVGVPGVRRQNNGKVGD